VKDPSPQQFLKLSQVLESALVGAPPGFDFLARLRMATSIKAAIAFGQNPFSSPTALRCAAVDFHYAPAQHVGKPVARRTPTPRQLRNGGLLEIDNSAAERTLRAVVMGRKNYLFFGSDSGGERAASLYSLIATAKLNGIDPEFYLHTVLARIIAS
jgi:hypothetical protein